MCPGYIMYFPCDTFNGKILCRRRWSVRSSCRRVFCPTFTYYIYICASRRLNGFALLSSPRETTCDISDYQAGIRIPPCGTCCRIRVIDAESGLQRKEITLKLKTPNVTEIWNFRFPFDLWHSTPLFVLLLTMTRISSDSGTTATSWFFAPPPSLDATRDTSLIFSALLKFLLFNSCRRYLRRTTFRCRSSEVARQHPANPHRRLSHRVRLSVRPETFRVNGPVPGAPSAKLFTKH